MFDELNKVLAEIADEEREQLIELEYEELILLPELQFMYECEMMDYDYDSLD